PKPRCLSRNALELTTDFRRGIGLWVKAVDLRKTAAQKYVDDRFRCLRRGRRCRTQKRQVIHAQAKQADRPGLQGGTAANAGMLKRGNRLRHGLPHGGHVWRECEWGWRR